jgi:hypothetical protein
MGIRDVNPHVGVLNPEHDFDDSGIRATPLVANGELHVIIVENIGATNGSRLVLKAVPHTENLDHLF